MVEIIESIVREAGKIVAGAKEITAATEEKHGPRDLVTKYDRAVQAFLLEKLAAAFPDARFFGEEEGGGSYCGTGLLFVIDPIDGTANFVHGLDQSAVSVALLRDGKAIAGVVYNPFDGEMYTAEKGKGAYRNGRPISVSAYPLREAIVMYGTGIYYRETFDDTLRITRRFFEEAADLRRFGSAALDLCYLACGKVDAFFEVRLCPWDYAAAALILQEAGGTVTDFAGDPLPYDRRSSVIAGTPRTYRDAFLLVQ